SGAVGLAFGQATCQSASAKPVPLRAEGKSELLADLTITCSTFGSSSPSGNISIQVYLSPATQITSKVLNSASGLSEATAITSAGSIQGTAAGSTLTFGNVPVPALAPFSSYTVTLTNVRVDASPFYSSSAFTSIQMTELVSGSPGVINPSAV